MQQQAFSSPPQVYQPVYQQMQAAPLVEKSDKKKKRMLKRAKKSLHRCSKFQLFFAYAMMIGGGLSLVHSIFMFLTIESYTNITVPVQRGTNTLNFQLEKCGLMLMMLLKTLGSLMLMKWGCTSVRTFKPIMKDLQNEELSEASGQPVVELKNPKKQPVPIKTYKKFVKRILLGFIGLLLGMTLYGRCYAIRQANHFIEKEFQIRAAVATG